MLRALVLPLAFACLALAATAPIAVADDRMQTCRAAADTARIAVLLFRQLHDTARACVEDGAETRPCVMLHDFVTDFDGAELTAALATFDRGLVALCVGLPD